MQRSNYSSQKPENVLKRVNELISASGNADREKKYALEQLHAIFAGPKKNKWQKLYEPIMKRHLELCVDLKDQHFAKDGLHQYRNMVQNIDPLSLETVIMHLMDLAESRATEAREKANKVALAAAAKISDLEQEETPESIMLSSMTEEGAKDRTDREVVVPWLKFLWEIYRAVLELLYKNAKLEKVYHKTCEKAFKFCLDYRRTLEFKRLCEMLRTQLSNLKKMAVLPQRGTRIMWEWSPESIELQLQTRFSQLEVATTLELWNESFRTVEDIHEIKELGKKTPKSKLMVSYYEKLTRIFWVSENHLFHAYAWYRYYTLCSECRKDLKPEDKTLQASCVLLAALCIPSVKEAESNNALLNDDEVAAEKTQRMAMLLDFQANPTRQALLSEMVAKGILNDVFPPIAELYQLLEKNFQPLKLAKGLSSVFDLVKSVPELSFYSLSLQKIAILRTIQQLSRVYSSVKLDFVKNLFSSLDLTFPQIERLIIEGVAKKQIQLRFDHTAGCIRFQQGTALGSSAIETQLSQLGSALNKIARTITAPRDQSTEVLEAAASERRTFFDLVLANVDNEHAAALERKHIIERRKEGLERLQQERLREEKERLEKEEKERINEEKLRLEQEEKDRKIQREKLQKEQMNVEFIAKAIASTGKLVDKSLLEKMDDASRKKTLEEAKSEAQKAKEDEARRLTDQAKRLDYITRALRIESAAEVQRRYEEQVKEDLESHEMRVETMMEQLRADHDLSLVEKSRVAKMQPQRTGYEEGLLIAQRAEYEKRVKKLVAIAKDDYRKRKVARARMLKAAEDERLEEEEEMERERIRKEEEDRIMIERHEELRRERQIKEEIEREEERVREMQAEQRRRDMEAMREAKLKREAELFASGMGRGAAPAVSSAADEQDNWRRPGPPPPAKPSPIGSGPARGLPVPAPSAASSETASDWRSSKPAAPAPSEDGNGWRKPVRDQPAAPTPVRSNSNWEREKPPAHSTERESVVTAADSSPATDRAPVRAEKPEGGASGAKDLESWARGSGGAEAAGNRGPDRNRDRGERSDRDSRSSGFGFRNNDRDRDAEGGSWGRSTGGQSDRPKGRDSGRSGGDRDSGRPGGDRDSGRPGGDRDSGRPPRGGERSSGGFGRDGGRAGGGGKEEGGSWRK